MATKKYAKESMLYGANENIPKNLRADNMVGDDLMNSVGLYSKQDIRNARFTRFSRFGRVLDPYGRVNPGREYLFFVKPDLHICIPTGIHAVHRPPPTISDVAGIHHLDLCTTIAVIV